MTRTSNETFPIIWAVFRNSKSHLFNKSLHSQVSLNSSRLKKKSSLKLIFKLKRKLKFKICSPRTRHSSKTVSIYKKCEQNLCSQRFKLTGVSILQTKTPTSNQYKACNKNHTSRLHSRRLTNLVFVTKIMNLRNGSRPQKRLNEAKASSLEMLEA